MSDCCSVGDSPNAPVVMPCPVSGTRSKQVDMLTVKSLVRQFPLGMPNTQYYFCEAPDCDAVYFPLDKQAPLFRQDDLMVRVGSKETAEPIPVCYCFGFTRKDIQREIAETGQSTVANRVSAEVKAGNCACEVKNPSGKCCLGDITRIAKDRLSQKGESPAMTEHKGACCSSPAAMCYWFATSLIAWGALSLVGVYWHPLRALSPATILFAMAIGCVANWLRNRTFHCGITGPLFFVTALVFLLSDMTTTHVSNRLVWPFLLIGVGVAFLLEWRFASVVRPKFEDATADSKPALRS